jgi:uncharacterized protein YndB with AHSA1/START domain
MNTATIDDETFTLTFERRLRASREDVFDAWTHPEDLAEWWDPTGTPLTRCQIDLRPGGAFVFENAGHGATLRVVPGADHNVAAKAIAPWLVEHFIEA